MVVADGLLPFVARASAISIMVGRNMGNRSQFLFPIHRTVIILYKYSLFMHVIKFESFAKFIFECKTFIYMWVYLFAINILFEYK